MLGDCLFALERIEEAREAFSKALCINADDVQARRRVQPLVRLQPPVDGEPGPAQEVHWALMAAGCARWLASPLQP